MESASSQISVRKASPCCKREQLPMSRDMSLLSIFGFIYFIFVFSLDDPRKKLVHCCVNMHAKFKFDLINSRREGFMDPW